MASSVLHAQHRSVVVLNVRPHMAVSVGFERDPIEIRRIHQIAEANSLGTSEERRKTVPALLLAELCPQAHRRQCVEIGPDKQAGLFRIQRDQAFNVALLESQDPALLQCTDDIDGHVGQRKPLRRATVVRLCRIARSCNTIRTHADARNMGSHSKVRSRT
jgi:hypothetical protein